MGGLAGLGSFGIVVIGVMVVMNGVVIAGLGQVFEALREIAVNTRASAQTVNPQFVPSQQTYGALGFITMVLSLISAFVVLSGALMAILGVVAMMR